MYLCIYVLAPANSSGCSVSEVERRGEEKRKAFVSVSLAFSYEGHAWHYGVIISLPPFSLASAFR